MTMDVSTEAPTDGRYKPTFAPTQTITLSNLSFITESPNKNEADLVEIQHKLRFEADSTMSVMTILKLFMEQLMLLDSHAYLLSKDSSRHFQNSQDFPKAQTELQKLFPATILHRRSGNRIVLRLTIISSQTFSELNRLGIITWANKNRMRIEEDIYKESDVRDCLWIAGRDSHTSKPHLHEYLTQIFTTNDYNTDEQAIIQEYTSKHGITDNKVIPPFAIYYRQKIKYKKLSSQGLIIRCDATSCQFFVKFLTRANTSGIIPIQKGSFIPLSVSKQNEKATISAMDLQNKYLTLTSSIPIIGLSFEALATEIDVQGDGHMTIETLIYQNCLSLEPTAKSHDLGRFNLVCLKTEEKRMIEYIETDFPMMWKLIPTDVASKFVESLHINYPRLTSGYTGVTSDGSNNNSVIINDPQSISPSASSTSQADNPWTKPPKIKRPPPFVSVIYNETSSQTNRRNKNDNKSRASSTKSQTTSDLSTMVSDLREEVTKEFQEHTAILSALRDEIAQLRQLHSQPTRTDIISEIRETQKQEVATLRQELESIKLYTPKDATPAVTTNLQDIVAKLVENMVPLIIEAVRQSLTPDQRTPDQHDHPKRSRLGSTPIHLQLAPTNLMDSYPNDSELPETISTPPHSPSTTSPIQTRLLAPYTPIATSGDVMEE